MIIWRALTIRVCVEMLEWAANIIALIVNPISLLIFLVVMRYVRKERKKKAQNSLWASHEGRGA